MKTLFKSPVFAAFVALFLLITLSGCDGKRSPDEMGFAAGSQQQAGGNVIENTSRTGFQGGSPISFLLREGVYSISVHYVDQTAGHSAKSEGVKAELASQGINVTRVVSHSVDSSEFEFLPIRKTTKVVLDTAGINQVVFFSSGGKMVVHWSPQQGEDVVYKYG